MARRRNEPQRLHGRMLSIYTAVWLMRRFSRVARNEARRTWRTSSRRPHLARR